MRFEAITAISVKFAVFRTVTRVAVFKQLSQHMALLVGPCHHGMARPQFAGRGTVSDKEGSCEYIE